MKGLIITKIFHGNGLKVGLVSENTLEDFLKSFELLRYDNMTNATSIKLNKYSTV